MRNNSIIKSTIMVSGALLLIKLLGVIKQALIASICGASYETDAYFISTGVTMAFCTAIFSSISISLLSIHTERIAEKGRNSSNNLINATLRVFLPISIAISLLLATCSPLVAKFLAPAFTGKQVQVLSHYLRLMSIMFIFTCYYLIINVILETDKRFLPGKGQSFFQNLFICAATVMLYRRVGISALIYAFLFSGLFQCFQITWSARKTFKFVRILESEKEAIYKLIRLSLPLIAGNAIYEINDIVDKQIATGLGSGNVSYLSYGASINEVVTTLIISSLSTVLFAHYASWVAEGKVQEVGDNCKKYIEYLFVIILPIMALCFVSGDCIVDILYGRGNFNLESKAATTSVVYGYAAGFLFQATRANLVRVYYAFQNTRIPMINGAISIVVNIVFSLILSRLFGVGGIALATSIAMLLVSALLIPRIKQYIPGFRISTIFPDCIKATVITMIIGVCAHLIKRMIPFGSLMTLIITGCFILVVYSIFAIAINLSDARTIAKSFICKAVK